MRNYGQRVLGILAREKDGYAQKRLLEGLQDPSKALVPPEKALQLLSYDVHAEAYPVAREIVKEPPNPEAKREALRLLSADANSAPVFEKLLRDKEEDRDIRQISAAALQAVKPKRFQEQAREIVARRQGVRRHPGNGVNGAGAVWRRKGSCKGSEVDEARRATREREVGKG